MDTNPVGVLMHQKALLPAKACAVCGRPFVWRKKWAQDWDAVKYCSERCRRQRGKAKTA
ncbi:DUF2256 domain-containing protein [Methylomonas sp. BW4-1]|uniref:DUF2256 domain-containing protein n=1 Tax=Methylomonas sp. BW4-1 TaxID=3376685 RepID=UPI004041C113